MVKLWDKQLIIPDGRKELKTRGAAGPTLELLGIPLRLVKPSLKILHSFGQLHSNSSPIYNSGHFEIGHLSLHNIKYNIT